ncbi:MAG: hypothetical protein IRF12RH_05240 [Rickettsia helvetica]|uniref:Uncharacterized protein n=1 Tax=Rickettsia helvetica TaxID=35789 RepID=A0ABP0T541_RICHE
MSSLYFIFWIIHKNKGKKRDIFDIILLLIVNYFIVKDLKTKKLFDF